MKLIKPDELIMDFQALGLHNITTEFAICLVKNASTIDAVPIKHGHWVRWHEEVYDSFGVAYVPHCKCSECGMGFDPYIANYINYCSNCGAKMDKRDNNHEKTN